MKNGKIAVKTRMSNTKTEALSTFSHSPQAIREAICLKAYNLYCERKGTAGNDIEDWLKAEKLVLKDILQLIKDERMSDVGI